MRNSSVWGMYEASEVFLYFGFWCMYENMHLDKTLNCRTTDAQTESASASAQGNDECFFFMRVRMLNNVILCYMFNNVVGEGSWHLVLTHTRKRHSADGRFDAHVKCLVIFVVSVSVWHSTFMCIYKFFVVVCMLMQSNSVKLF